MLLLSAPGYIVSLSTFVAEIYRKSEQTKGAIHTYTHTQHLFSRTRMYLPFHTKKFEERNAKVIFKTSVYVGVAGLYTSG